MTDLTAIRALLASVAGFTPGPWRGDRNDGTIKYTVRGAGRLIVLTVDHKNARYGFVVGDNYDGHEMGGEHDADERLFLAAPDLHRELTEAVGEIERLRAHNARMADLLNKVANAMDLAEHALVWTDGAEMVTSVLPLAPDLRRLAAGEVDDV